MEWTVAAVGLMPRRGICVGHDSHGRIRRRAESSSRPKAQDSQTTISWSQHPYSTRSATIGSIREALRAGK